MNRRALCLPDRKNALDPQNHALSGRHLHERTAIDGENAVIGLIGQASQPLLLALSVYSSVE